MRFGLAFGLIGYASAVAAECPVTDQGVRLTYTDGVVEEYRPAADGSVQVEGFDGGEVTHRLDLLHGVYLARYVEVHAGVEAPSTAAVYTYPQGALAPEAPVVGARWSGEVLVETVDGAAPETQVHEIGLPVELVIDSCTTTAVPITITYGVDAEYLEIVHFLPDYGVGYLQGYQNAGRDLNELTVALIEALP